MNLLPCPFCAGTAQYLTYQGIPRVECMDCAVFIMTPDAAKDWNTRPRELELQEEIDGLYQDAAGASI